MRLERGDKVALLMDNGLLTAQLLFGAMYGGLVSVPLNVHAGVSQLSYTLDHCDAKVVFVEEKYTDLIKEVLATVRRVVGVIFADIDRLVAEQGAPPPPVPATGDVALLMYTSGSTGQPKGAIHTHGTILAQAKTSVASHELTLSDRSLLVLPLYHFNAECVTLIPTLLSGGSVVVPHHFVVSEFWSWMDAHHCTWSALVPTIIAQLLDWKHPGVSRAAASGCIRFLRSSSASLSPSLHREFLDKFKLPLIQAMGSTEAGIIFSNPAPPGMNKIGSIGLPWGFEVRIVNAEGADLPPGEPGEVLLRGPAMMPGYYKDPVTTAAVLDADKWLHTGDIAYRDEDGYFFVVGRSKELIIKGGMNIAPKQIDEVLESHPAVLEAAAVGVPDPYLGEDLVAFVVLRDGMSCDERKLLSFCENHLGHFKTPTRIHFVEDLPKGPSGKVQRLRLLEGEERPATCIPSEALPLTLNGEVEQKTVPKPNFASGVDKTEFVVPSTPTEIVLARIWCEVLGLKQVGVHDNFFELGGDSILSSKVVAKANQAGLRLTPKQIFQDPRIADLAACAKRISGPAIEQGTITGNVPLTPIQRRFFERNLHDFHHWNQTMTLEVACDADPILIEQAIQHLVVHHDALRLRFRRLDTGWEQSNAGIEEKVSLACWDFGGLNKADQNAAMQKAATQLQLDVADGPIARFAWLSRGTGQTSRLLLVVHHLAIDGVSWRILLQDLQTAYDQLRRGEPVKLPPKTTSFRRWARRLSEHALSTELDRELEYWPVVSVGDWEQIPTDFAGGENTEASAVTVSVALEPQETEIFLRDTPKAYNTDVGDVLLAALALVLSRWLGKSGVYINLESHNREELFKDLDLSRTVGCLITMFPVRLDLRHTHAASAVFKSVKEQLLRVPNRGIGYGLLRYLRSDDRVQQQLTALQEPEVAFNFLGEFDQTLPETSSFSFAIGSIGQARSPNARRNHLLEISSLVIDGKLKLHWSYSQNVHRRATIEQLAQDCLASLRELIAYCVPLEPGGFTPSDFAEADLDQQELDQLISELNDLGG